MLLVDYFDNVMPLLYINHRPKCKPPFGFTNYVEYFTSTCYLYALAQQIRLKKAKASHVKGTAKRSRSLLLPLDTL